MNKEWFVFKGTHHLGPFSIEEMEEFYRVKEINSQTMVWKEGSERWEPLSKTKAFHFLFTHEVPVEVVTKPTLELPKHKKKEAIKSNAQSAEDAPPPLPHIPTLPKTPQETVTHHSVGHVELFDDDLPPPIPLDAILAPRGQVKLRIKSNDKSTILSRITLISGIVIFAVIIGWYALTQRDAGIQLRIKGLMPVYLEKLEMTAINKSSRFEVALALSLDSLTLWGSTNYPGEIFANIQLKSVPKKVLGTEDVVVTVKGEFKNHIGKFTRMALTQGTKFLPGEYAVHVEARETHFLNRNFKSLSGISFFKSLNKTYSYNDTTLIYAGTPREFEKRIIEYSASITGEMLKPYQDKLERVQTFESILNATSQNYLMELERAKTGKSISLFETKFIKEISPLLQTLIVKASELSKDPKFNEDDSSKQVIAPYREQVLLGKQIGEMASDMITKTEKFKKLRDIDKTALRSEFDKRAKGIKLQIDMNVKKLEEQIQKISK